MRAWPSLSGETNGVAGLGAYRRLATTAPSVGRPWSEVLWAPGAHGSVEDTKGLTRAIQARLSDGGSATIVAQGPASAANALRALARASRVEHGAIEFHVTWEEKPKSAEAVATDAVSGSSSSVVSTLRFHAEVVGKYDAFRAVGWSHLKEYLVGNSTEVAALSRAMANEQRKRGRCVVKTISSFNESGDGRVATMAKALASTFRYNKERKPAWCVATHAEGHVLRVHLFGVGERLRDVPVE